MTQTKPDIVKIVVWTVAACCAFYVFVKGACVMWGINPPDNAIQGFDNAGNVLLGMLAGLLMKTATAQEPTTTTQTTVTRTEPEPDK